MTKLLVGVNSGDPVIYVAVAALSSIVALVACYV
jgi:hypothetical protein